MDPYTVFGLPRSVSEKELRRKFRQLVVRLHPDKGGPFLEQAERTLEHWPARTLACMDSTVGAAHAHKAVQHRRQREAKHAATPSCAEHCSLGQAMRQDTRCCRRPGISWATQSAGLPSTDRATVWPEQNARANRHAPFVPCSMFSALLAAGGGS